ncbi:MAG: hypothetical protein DWI10_09205 [Planctomycetota bacterium]|jgi:hypothetical protein|nr:MAG: hypothetical protein DWI10_09205 [Planctomycetota bacterium]
MVEREADGIWITLKEVIFAAPSEVAAAVATASGLCRWLAVIAEYPTEEGETLSISWDREWTHSTDVRVLAYECDRMNDGHARVKWEWFPTPLHEHSTPVELTVSPLPDKGGDTGGARVIVRHGPFLAIDGDLDAILPVADSAESWRWYLCNLRSVLEAKHDMRAIRPL